MKLNSCKKQDKPDVIGAGFRRFRPSLRDFSSALNAQDFGGQRATSWENHGWQDSSGFGSHSWDSGGGGWGGGDHSWGGFGGGGFGGFGGFRR